MKLSLLYEAGMSRRSFLKSLGAAALGASPLGQMANAINPSNVAKAVAKTILPKRYLIAWTGTHYGRGGAPDLTSAVDKVLWAHERLQTMFPGNKIVSIGDEDYGFAVEIGEDDYQSLKEIDDQLDNQGLFLDSSKDGKQCDYGWLGDENVVNPVQRWVNEYARYDLQDMMHDYYDVQTLEQHDLAKLSEEPSKLADAKEQIMDEIRAQDESLRRYNEKKKQEKRKADAKANTSAQREVGYERKNQFDPRSSRPAQALEPWESKLRDILSI